MSDPEPTETKSLFNPEEPLTLGTFLGNFFKFVSTNVTDVFPLFFSYCMFNYTDAPGNSAIAGLAISCFMFYFGFSYDFYEVENTLCGPFFAKKNYKFFAVRTIRVFLINLSFFLFSCCAMFVNKPLLEVFGVEQDIVDDTTKYMYLYVPTVGLLFMITNFLRGEFYRFYGLDFEIGILIQIF